MSGRNNEQGRSSARPQLTYVDRLSIDFALFTDSKSIRVILNEIFFSSLPIIGSEKRDDEKQTFLM